jgi:hypothetical protein
VDKHEKWHFQVAEKAGVKLSSDWTARFFKKGPTLFKKGPTLWKGGGNDGTTKMDFGNIDRVFGFVRMA